MITVVVSLGCLSKSSSMIELGALRLLMEIVSLRTRNKTVAELVRAQKSLRILTNPATCAYFVRRS